jgi:hypothetical protein
MTAFYVDPAFDEATRRRQLYDGALIVLAPTPSSTALCAHGADMLNDAFRGLDPRTAQFEMPVEKYAAVLSDLKPRFIHHPRSKELIQALLAEVGCDLERTYFDVPRMRTSTSNDYLTSGIAYAFHPHRDTWYSAPPCQINWWLPIFEIDERNTLAFHPHYWDHPVKNGSASYDYERWNAESRHNAAQHIKTDTRVQPKPEEPMDLDPQFRFVGPPGSILLFAAAQMHSSVPNDSGVTRCSIDFRTVNRDDLEAMDGAPNIDSACTGTTLNDYLSGADLSHLPEDLIELYRPGIEAVAPVLTAA